jgi:hypothetical protein
VVAGKARVTRIPAWVCKDRATRPDAVKCSCPADGIAFWLGWRCSSVADRCEYASSSRLTHAKNRQQRSPLPFMRWLLDLRFIDSIEETIGRILEAPTRWRIIEEDVRRCLTHVFPHGILYTIERDYILILAVMHCSREPGYWRSRMSPRLEGR